MKNKKTDVFKIAKIVIQLLCLLALPGLFADSLNGIKALIDAAFAGDMSGLLVTLFPTVLLVVMTLLFGRIFCGFMCAFGSMGDALNYLGKKVFKIEFNVSENADHILKWIKYVVLIEVITIWVLGMNIPEGANPWDVFGALVSFPPNFSYATGVGIIGLILLLVIVFASLFIERFFCRYICPMGALFSLVSKVKFLKVKKDRNVCGSCKYCTGNCKMGEPLYKTDKVTSGECVGCMQCVSQCPKNNAQLSFFGKKVSPVVMCVIAVVTVALYFGGSFAINAVSEKLSEDAAAAATAVGDYVDGVYEGSGMGFSGTTTVSVTIENGVITDIETVSTDDDGRYYNKSFLVMKPEIIAAQGSEVNAVTGASYSSAGIAEAVADALKKAERTYFAEVEIPQVTQQETTEATTGVTWTTGETTTEQSTGAITSTTEESTTEITTDDTTLSDLTTQEQTETQQTTEENTTEKETTEETTTKASASYKDGTYEGSGQGRKGTITVSVTIKDGEIVSVESVSTNDDYQWYNRALSSISQSVTDKQSANVDTVSGATLSSMGIIEAIEDALSKAV